MKGHTVTPPTSEPALLTIDAILAADDIQFMDVACPEWGGTVRIYALSAQQHADALAAARRGKDKELDSTAFATNLLAASMRITVDQAAALQAKSTKVIARLRNAYDVLNGWSMEVAGADEAVFPVR